MKFPSSTSSSDSHPGSGRGERLFLRRLCILALICIIAQLAIFELTVGSELRFIEPSRGNGFRWFDLPLEDLRIERSEGVDLLFFCDSTSFT